MAVTSFPYTSVGGDRTITAFQEASGFNLFVSSGVVEATAGDLSTKLQVSAVPDTMQVSVAAGDAVIIGHRYMQTAAETLTLTAGGSNDRIDVIAVESNRENATRAAQLVVVEGAEAAEPVAPTLTTTDTVYQVALAWVTVPASATSLNAATITDKRVASRPRGLSTEAQAVVDKFAYKLPVKAATTENITLSGEQTIDGVSIVALDRVLVKNQTDAEDNGIYIASADAWTRANDFDADVDAVSGSLVHIEQGTGNGTKTYKLITASPIVLGTTALTWELFDTVAPEYLYRATGTNDGEIISGLVNDFLEATGDWTGTTALTLKLVISGTVGLPATPAFGSGTFGDPYAHFLFSSTQSRGARVLIDWSDARGITWTDTTSPTTYARLIIQTGAGARVSHHGLASYISMTAESNQPVGVYASTGAELTMTQCRIGVNGTAQPWGARFESAGTCRLDKCEVIVTNTAASDYAEGGSNATYGIYNNASRVWLNGCKISATTTSADLSYANTTVAIFTYESASTFLNDCEIFAYSSGGNSSKYAYGMGLYVAGTNGLMQARGCCIKGYGTATYGYGYAVRDSSSTSNDRAIQLLGCCFPTASLAGVQQTGAIYLCSTAGDDTRYQIMNCVFGGANSSPNIVLNGDGDGLTDEDYLFGYNLFTKQTY